jgi:aspartokinase-like uncharacterized kinase
MVAQKTWQRRKSDPFPRVVKLGGSLLTHLPRIVPALCASPSPHLIIPGGGTFADDVRESGLADDDAHWMAIAAMDLYGRLIAAQGIGTTTHLIRPKKTCVLLPYCVMQERDPLPHTWDVTSDTIAAWIASVLGTDLLVLKSVAGITVGGVFQETITRPVKTDVVDPFFIPFVLKHRVRATILNGTDVALLKKYFKGEQVKGTSICAGAGTTF